MPADEPARLLFDKNIIEKSRLHKKKPALNIYTLRARSKSTVYKVL